MSKAAVAAVDREEGKRILASMRPSKKPNKFKNTKVVIPQADGDDIVIDSKREAKRWRELQLMEATGEIKNLERQVTYKLVVNGVKVCAIKPDFRYNLHTGQVVIEDVKSEITRKNPAYRIKKKLFEALHRGLTITEIL